MNRKQRLDALAARLAVMGTCPICHDEGFEGVALRFNGGKGDPRDKDPRGCTRCGKVGEVVTLICVPDDIGPPPSLPIFDSVETQQSDDPIA